VLKHDRLVLSKDAVARLVRSLDPEKKADRSSDVETIARLQRRKKCREKTGPQKKPPSLRQKEKRGRDNLCQPSISDIRRPIITVKGLGVRSSRHGRF